MADNLRVAKRQNGAVRRRPLAAQPVRGETGGVAHAARRLLNEAACLDWLKSRDRRATCQYKAETRGVPAPSDSPEPHGPATFWKRSVNWQIGASSWDSEPSVTLSLPPLGGKSRFVSDLLRP